MKSEIKVSCDQMPQTFVKSQRGYSQSLSISIYIICLPLLLPFHCSILCTQINYACFYLYKISDVARFSRWQICITLAVMKRYSGGGCAVQYLSWQDLCVNCKYWRERCVRGLMKLWINTWNLMNSDPLRPPLIPLGVRTNNACRRWALK